VSFVGVQDVLYVANTVRTVTYETVTVYAVVGLAYWAVCLAVSVVFQAIERSLPLARATRAAVAAKASMPLGRTAEIAL
jgi:polar amino acid transport system permease protein